MSRIFVLGSIPDSLVNFRRDLLEEMVARGNEVYACAPGANDKIKNTLVSMGVIYQDINLARTSLNPLNDLKTFIKLVHLLRTIRPHLFLGYTIKPVIYGSIAARMSGIAKIYSMIEGLGYSFSNTGLKSRIVGMMVRILYRLALQFNTRVFFLNPDNSKLFLEKRLVSDSKKCVLLNGIGVDLDAFTPLPNHAVDPSFILISRLIKLKGIGEYIAAANILRRKYPNIKFKLVGMIDDSPTGYSKTDLEHWVDLGTVEYLGFQPDVRPALAQASVFVLPTYYPEGLPRTIMEAMAMAKPIITTDVPGCRETVAPGENGFLIPIKDVSALVEAMEYYLLHPDEIQRMGVASRRIAETKFDVHKVNAEILRTLELL